MRNVFTILATLLLSFLSLIGVLHIARLFEASPSQFRNPELIFSVSTVSMTLGILILPIAIVCSVQKWVHKQKLNLFSQDKGFKIFWSGVFLGLIIKFLALIVAVIFEKNDVEFSITMFSADFVTWPIYFGWFLFLLVLNSFNEELVYRAYPIRNLENHCHPLVAIAASAIVFSLMHFVIEEPEFNRFLYRLCFGIAAGVLYVGTGNIWTAVGFHTGWNLVALSISEVDWRLGGLLNLTGLNRVHEEVANIALLAIAALIFYRVYCPLKHPPKSL